MTARKKHRIELAPAKSPIVRAIRSKIAKYALNHAKLELLHAVVSNADTLHLAYQEGWLAALGYRTRTSCPFPLAAVPNAHPDLPSWHGRAWLAGWDAGEVHLKHSRLLRSLRHPTATEKFRRGR